MEGLTEDTDDWARKLRDVPDDQRKRSVVRRTSGDQRVGARRQLAKHGGMYTKESKVSLLLRAQQLPRSMQRLAASAHCIAGICYGAR
jgi:hypothetical protein